MHVTNVRPGARVLEYVDPLEGFVGFCIYDCDDSRIAAGGCRVEVGLTQAKLGILAARMTVKERVVGLSVDGAKCGIDYDPRAPGKSAALARFLGFLRDELNSRLSMGCDMGTRWHELENIARGGGLRSIKVAIRRAQELSDAEFNSRLSLLDEPVGKLTLAERRAGHALACSVLAAAGHTNARLRKLTCSLQGFGNIGRAAAQTLATEGVRIVAVADEYGCLAKTSGLDVAHLLSGDRARPLAAEPGAVSFPRELLPALSADVCILAAGEDGVRADGVGAVAAPVVVVGANYGLSLEMEDALAVRGVLVIPDTIGGIGGPVSMEALFGGTRPSSAEEVMGAIRHCMDALVDDVLCSAARTGTTARQVAEELALATPASKDLRPYGHSPYFSTRHKRPSSEGFRLAHRSASEKVLERTSTAEGFSFREGHRGGQMTGARAGKLVSERDIKFLSDIVTSDDAVYISGSKVEGLGNPCSDVDFFIMVDTVVPKLQQPALQGDYYIDCEYHGRGDLLELAKRLNQLAESADPENSSVKFSDLVLYHRTAIGIPVVNSERFAAVQAHFLVSHLATLYRVHALKRSEDLLAGARAALVVRDWMTCLIGAREAAAWTTEALLAADGETYPGPKWRFEKAERRYGASSPTYKKMWDLQSVGTRSVPQYLKDVEQFALGAGALLTARKFPQKVTCTEEIETIPASDGLLLLSAGRVHKVSGWGEKVWRELVSGCAPAALPALVVEELSLAPPDAHDVVAAFLKDLEDRGLIRSDLDASHPKTHDD